MSRVRLLAAVAFEIGKCSSDQIGQNASETPNLQVVNL